MTKILFCVNSLSLGGVERRLSELIIGLGQLHKYSLYCVVNNLTRLLDPKVRKYVKFIPINSDVSYHILIQSYTNVIYEIKPNIVHCWTIKQCEIINNISPLIRSTFIYICGAVNSAFQYHKGSHHEAIMNECIQKADIIISNSVAGLVAKRVPIEKSIVIKNGYNFDRVSRNNCSVVGDDIIQKMNQYQNIILMACRLCPEKDIQMFIDLAKYSNINHKYLYVLVGDGKSYKEYSQEITSTNNILYLGYRRDVNTLINMSNICVLFSNPPHKEGISNFIMESMAQSKVVIATTGGGTNEIIVSGQNGLLVEPHDYLSVANHIEQLCSNSVMCELLGQQAYHTIRKDFNFQSKLNDYRNLYATLLEKYDKA